MIKENQKIINKLTIFVDALVILISFLLTWYLRVYSGIMTVEGGLLSFKEYLIPVILMIPIYIFIYNFKGLYNNERIMFLSKEIGKIITSNILGIFCLLYTSPSPRD